MASLCLRGVSIEAAISREHGPNRLRRQPPGGQHATRFSIAHAGEAVAILAWDEHADGVVMMPWMRREH